jgi:hypothetical protein
MMQEIGGEEETDGHTGEVSCPVENHVSSDVSSTQLQTKTPLPLHPQTKRFQAGEVRFKSREAILEHTWAECSRSLSPLDGRIPVSRFSP